MVNTTYEFSSQCFGGKADRGVIEPLLADAAVTVESFIIMDIPEVLREAVMTAICIQADYLAECVSSQEFTSFKLGDFSASCKSGGNNDISSLLCIKAKAYLDSKGLLFRGGAKL